MAVDLERALRYPYAAPGYSFLFDPEVPEPVSLSAADVLAATAGRHAVLAIGSNAAPEQLTRKFAKFSGSRTIPVIRTTVAGYDVVYAAQISGYGAVPATLTRSAGTKVELHVTFLDDAQLKRMNETECVGSNYETALLDGDAAEGVPGPVSYYSATAGVLEIDAAPVALAAMTATGRRFPALYESEVLEHVAGLYSLTVAVFVTQVVEDRAFRQSVNRRLAELKQGAP